MPMPLVTVWIGIDVGLFFFFFNDTATTEIYTLSLHDALPIYSQIFRFRQGDEPLFGPKRDLDRKSTRLNSSHLVISYAVFCLKKKNNFRCLTNSHIRLAFSALDFVLVTHV